MPHGSHRTAEGELRGSAAYATEEVVGKSFWGASARGYEAHAALFAVALLDDVDGTSWEDAGSTALRFGAQLGRCMCLVTRVVAKASAQILSPAEVCQRARRANRPENKWEQLHLDSSGRARGFVTKGMPLAFFGDKTALRAPFDAWVGAWGVTLRGTPAVTLVQEHAWQSGMKVSGALQKSVLSAVWNSLCASVPVSFLRAELSIVSRNAPATYLSALALRLLLARGVRLRSAASCARLPGISAVALQHDCSLERVFAARELTPGLCLHDRYPVVLRSTGRRAGVARVLLQEMGIPEDKAAIHVVNMHVGGRQRRGSKRSQGGALEEVETAITKLARPGDTTAQHPFDATRGPVQAEARRPQLIEAMRGGAALTGHGMYAEREG